MNLRNAKNYTIGFDIGTSSVGWAVVDASGRLYHVKGKPSWGSRLFSEADKAADTRGHRGQRRRYDRRRQRLDCLQGFFLEEMAKVDPDFFVRLNQSRLLRQDRHGSHDTDYRWTLFSGGATLDEPDYYELFPTIYHLREYLMHSTTREDIRLIYLALHNIVKYRGNFLHQDEGTSLCAANADAAQAAKTLCSALEEYVRLCTEKQEQEDELSCCSDAGSVKEALDRKGIRRDDRKDLLIGALGLAGDKKTAKGLSQEIAKACLGYKAKFEVIFTSLDGSAGTNMYLSEEDKVAALTELLSDDELPLFEALQTAYSAYVLCDILKGSPSLSKAMISSYERHKEDLEILKELIRTYFDKETYDEFFRGAKDERGNYDINELKQGTYTSYIAGEKLANKKGTNQEDLLKTIKALFDKNPRARADERFKQIEERLYASDSDFLAKQKTRSNGTIPYQLHLEEMDAIIKAQGKFYPFLLEQREAIEKLVSSRIPYYVGPLNTSPDPRGNYPHNAVDPTRKFAWSRRRPGMESVKVYPWNYSEVIDTDETAERFIRRMTGICSYLLGEPVLPKCSLLYEEYCVLNELNGVKWACENGNFKRFDYTDREAIITDLFKRHKSVSTKNVTAWLQKIHGYNNTMVRGTQGETGFESKLNSYHDFCRILDVNNLEDQQILSIDAIEEIILWNTVFEDRDILRRKITDTYGEAGGGYLTAKQIEQIVNKRYTGWGKLSEKFLTGLKVNIGNGSVSIMDVLRDGNPLPGKHREALVLMQIINDKELDFDARITAANKDYLEKTGALLSVDDMPGSPALRRGINQADRILKEIIGYTGHAPTNICIEVTRDDDMKNKGKRTSSRYKNLKTALQAFKAEAQLMGELEAHKNGLDDRRLMLYFAQNGKCMYSGDPLDINRLFDYQIDHIIPQSYIKDDSFDNTVLVKSAYNQRKLDSLLLDETIIRKRKTDWEALLHAKLISEKKFRNLTCHRIEDRQMIGFINRQLVETSQTIKFFRQMCEQRYPDTQVISVRAAISSGVRDNWGLTKCRELNHYHHAHDAFLACQVARFIHIRYPMWEDPEQLTRIRKYVKELAEGYQSGERVPGRSGFIADSMTGLRKPSGSVYIDRDSGEVLWDYDAECDHIRSALGYKDCFVTRMLEEQTGAFWDETIYSPRDKANGKNLAIPLKVSGKEGLLDPKKYGGKQNERNAYWFIFVARNKRGECRYFFEGMPIHLVAGITDEDSLLHFAQELAEQQGCRAETVNILRSRVLLRQRILLDGAEYYLYGMTGNQNEIRPAFELVCDIDKSAIVDYVAHWDDSDYLTQKGYKEPPVDADLLWMYDWLTEGLEKRIPKLAKIAKLTQNRTCFCDLERDKRYMVLKQLIMKANGTSQTADLSLLNGSKHAALLGVSVMNNLPSIVWVDQSVTGIYERRTNFEELRRGL